MLLETIRDVFTGHHKPWQPDWRIPPGEILLDHMAENHVGPLRMRDLLGLNATQMSDLLDGTLPVGAELSADLERATYIPSYVWLRLEDAWRR